jgi:molybdopterin/thiamine biosynthesis adenylyltransferase
VNECDTIGERYEKSIGTLTASELRLLREKRVCIVGCGGLGGNVLEMLARLGVLHITVVDGDVFSPSNLNRQVLCTEANIGERKAGSAVLRGKAINSEAIIAAHPVFLSEENAEELLHDHDAIIDALDNIPSRLLLETYAEALGIPLVHGAVQGWMAQVAVVMPGDRTLGRLYATAKSVAPSAPSFTPAFCASLQVSETVKLLCGKKTIAKNHVLVFDLLDNTMRTFSV